METKRCETCGKTLPVSDFSKSYKNRCKQCVAEITKEKRNSNTTLSHKRIDWEQRRYEIAKAAMVGQLASPIVEGIDPNPSMQDVCIWSVKFADALIEELKKQNNG